MLPELEEFEGLTKRIGQGISEWAAKVDEFARGMLGPLGSTLFEELGLYYIGPVDGHISNDLLCVLNQVASLDSMGPVLIHIVMKEDQGEEDDQRREIFDEYEGGIAEQHDVTFSAGLSRGGLKPFCFIPSAFLQRAYDQVYMCNKLASRHVQIRLADSGDIPRCDICENAAGDKLACINGLPGEMTTEQNHQLRNKHNHSTPAEVELHMNSVCCCKMANMMIDLNANPQRTHGQSSSNQDQEMDVQNGANHDLASVVPVGSFKREFDK